MRISIIITMSASRLFMALAAMLLSGCAAGPTAADSSAGRPLVVTSNAVLADFAQQLGGDTITVRNITAKGADPHEYQPSAGDLRAFEHAAVIVVNGLGIEPWFPRARAATSPPGLIVTATTGVAADGDDPHVWLDPTNASIMVDNIADALRTALPSQATLIATNQIALTQALRQLDSDIARELAPLTDRRLVTNHDAFGYFARRYGFDVVGSVIPSFDTSAELSTSDVRRLVATIRAQGVRAVFSEAKVPAKSAAAIAEQAGVRVISGDDGLYGDGLGAPGTAVGTYLGMMQHNTTSILNGLR